MKCDCGEKPHSKDGGVDRDKGESGSDFGDSSVEVSSDPGASSTHLCRCNHGSRCVCALKKEPLDPVPEMDFIRSAPPTLFGLRKPRLMTASSEPALTVFTKGHHKSVHKHNDAAHSCGIPYHRPIPHSVPGNFDHFDRIKDMAQRSTDSLPLPTTVEQAPLQLQESISSAQQEVRLVQSEHGSPSARVLRGHNMYDSPVLPLDLSFAGYSHGIPSPLPDDYGYHSPGGFDAYFTPTEELPPLLSAGIVSPIDEWSGIDLPLGGGGFSPTYSQPPSYPSYDHSQMGQHGLPASSSSKFSEIGDYSPHYSLRNEQPIQTISPAVSDSHTYQLNSAPSYISVPQPSLSPEHHLDRRDTEGFLSNTATSPIKFEKHSNRVSFGSENYSSHPFSVQDAPEYAQSSVSPLSEAALTLPTPVEDADPLWTSPFHIDEVHYRSPNPPDNIWAHR